MFPGTETGLGNGYTPQARAHKAPAGTLTREGYIHAVRALAVEYALGAGTVTPLEASDLLAAKLVYGMGTGAYRGVCASNGWNERHAFIEIAATGEESTVQLAGTTIHETGHALAGFGAGHGKAWKAACGRLGLVDAQAAGQAYEPEGFIPSLWVRIAALGEPVDGKPTLGFVSGIGRTRGTSKPCPAGQGTRGGKSRGIGSGSRLRLHMCACPVRARVASDVFLATCGVCGTAFKLVVKKGGA